jgi:hypothetical protein
MIDEEGNYRASPPTWPPIVQGTISNIIFSHLVDMTRYEIGTVLEEKNFVSFFGK